MHHDTATLSIAGKVFLAGEYLALNGGPALVAAVEPRFGLKASRASMSLQVGRNPFHADSLAGQLWLRYEAFFRQYELSFTDAHNSKGGFGGSTAEFALLHGLLELKQWLCEESQPQFDLRKIWNEYRDLAQSQSRGKTALPSGADLIAQVNGYLTVFDRAHGKINQFSWLFQDLGFLLFRTNRKLNTHEHLKILPNFSTQVLEKSMTEILQSLETQDSSGFVVGISSYASELQNLNFVSEQTQSILQEMNHPHVLAKKGCGAMGADVICLFDRLDSPDAASRSEIIEKMQGLGCTYVGNEKLLTAGLKVESLGAPQGKHNEVHV